MATILIAEDDDGMRAVLSNALRQAGHDVVGASDGREALKLALEWSFDILVADVVMPGLDGVEVARRALQARPDLKVVFVTGFAAVTLDRIDGALKGSPVVSKPFHLRQLAAAIERVEAARGDAVAT